MSQIIYPITHLPPVIDIGKQTERGVTRIGFDMHEWLDDWPGMKFSVHPIRPGETESYFAESEMVGSVVFWLVGAVDTEKPGSGTVEVLGVTQDERKLSAMCRTSIANTNTATTAEIPEPNRPWVDQVILAGEGAKAGAQAASKSATAAAEDAEKASQAAVDAAESVKDVFVVKVDNDQMCSHTKEEIVKANRDGKVCLMRYYDGSVLEYNGLTKYGDESKCPVFIGSLFKHSSINAWFAPKVTVLNDRKTVFAGSEVLIANPAGLRFTGAVEAIYNGEKSVTVNIPNGALPETAEPLKQLVTDADGKVAWEDRLAYKYTTEGEVVNLAETKLEVVDDDGNGMLDDPMFLTAPWDADVMVGSVVTVSYNGVKYECPAVLFEADGILGAAVGKTDKYGFEASNPDAPFMLLCMPNAYGANIGISGVLYALDGATSVTLSVTSMQTQTTIKTIDPELLPSNIGQTSADPSIVVNVTLDSSRNVTACDKTYAEVAEAIAAGKDARAVVKDASSVAMFLRLALITDNTIAFNGTWISGSGSDALELAYIFVMTADGTNTFEQRTI